MNLPGASFQSDRRPSHDLLQRSFSLLISVLPATDAAFREALVHSESAFRLLDAWLGYNCVAALKRGVPKEFAQDVDARSEDFILAQCLTAPIDAQQLTGIPVLKALLLLGVAEGRKEAQVMVTLADGIYKARQKANWRAVMPRPSPVSLSVRDAIQHCQQHAQSLLSAPDERAKLETAWLEALSRWCELLPRNKRVFAPRVRAPSLPDRAENDDIDDRWPAPPILDVELGLDGPVVQDDDGAELELLPPSRAPEAPVVTPRAPAGVEDDPETEEGGEARRARTGFRSALQNQFLPWPNEHLNPLDAGSLFKAIRQVLQTGGPARDTVALLAWAQVTGQLVEQALEIGRMPQAEGSYLDGRTYMRYIAPQLNAWEPTAEQAQALRPHVTHVRLDLPVDLASWLEEKLPAQSDMLLREALRTQPRAAVERVRAWLVDIRKSTGGQQTLSRVEWWLPLALYRSKADHVPPHLLCAVNDGLPCPSAYYRAYPADELSALHRTTLARAGWAMPPAPEPPMDGREGWVGTRLNPEPADVKALWARVTLHFESIVVNDALPLHERHNAREVHEALSQMFQTFHRVVSDPMESLEFIDIGARRAMVDDKSQGDTRAHRLIPLADLAAVQCVEQIEHLRRLSFALAPTSPDTAKRITAIVDHPEWRAAPFRFLLNERLEIVRLTPKHILKSVEGLWDLPLNLARHFGSTWLLQQKTVHGQAVRDDALCSLLGHHDLGTQNLSMFSPLDFDALYGTLKPLLDSLVAELGLRSIPSFLQPIPPEGELLRSRARLPAKSFGHQRREQARAGQRSRLKEEAEQRIREHLGTRVPSTLTQADVNALFEAARRSTPNRRTYWAHERFEALRAALVDITQRFQDVKVELPAISLSIQDAAHLCSMDGLSAAAWLEDLRHALAEAHLAAFIAWRASRTVSHEHSIAVTVLSLVTESLVIDPQAWSAWHAGHRDFDVFIDEDQRSWLRMPLPSGNSRLYPVRRDLAERIATIPALARLTFEFKEAAQLATSLLAATHETRQALDFLQLLNLVQSASASRVPGVVLGYADGSHASVSPERMCLERRSGLPPTQAALAAWEASRPPKPAEDEEGQGTGRMPLAGAGGLKEVAEFRRRMSGVLAKMERKAPSEKARDRKKPSVPSAEMDPAPTTDVAAAAASVHASAVPGSDPDPDVPALSKKQPREPGPLKRMIAAIEEQWSDLVESPALPASCGLVAGWVHFMAVNGHAGGAYAPKTLRNYWFSWALRFVEEFGSIHPRQVSAAECEEIYFQIVENAKLKVRQHLYPPMRALHRYLVSCHGVTEIDWTELRTATGQGLTRVNANLIHDHEYLAALQMLRTDMDVSERVQVLQSAVLVLLYRFGLRIAECLGLQSGDLVFNADTQRWIVRIRRNQYRGLKSHNARRTVVLLEDLTPPEVEVLQAWTTHVSAFVAGTDIRPLFASTAAGAQRSDLYPRRVVALRVGQALRVATCDPAVRVHHCRHSYVTRLLLVGLNGSTDGLFAVQTTRDGPDLRSRICEVLTHETHATRRLLWAIAAQVGHASPLTGLATYAHGGHMVLWRWCSTELWAQAPDADAAEWLAWSAAVSLKTMQRDFQRKAVDEPGRRIETVLGQWSRLPLLGAGPRAARALKLPEMRVVEGGSSLVSADRIIDHARRFGRVDGLAEALLVNEVWVACVLHAAREVAGRYRTPWTPEAQWWIEPAEQDYPAHEGRAIEQGLEALQGLEPADLARHCNAIAPFLTPASRMVVIESDETLTSAAALAKVLVDDAKLVQILVPAKLPKRLSPAERERRDALARRQAEKLKKPFRQSKPRLELENGIEFDGAEALKASATQLGLSLAVHGRTAGAREGPHDWRRASARLALRIKENDYDRVRSAKVFTRILVSAIVACKAEELTGREAESDPC